VKLGIISPDGRDAMLQHAEQFAAAGIPFVFDPGQGLPMFDGEALKHFVELATWVTVNDYEGKMLSDRTGLSSEEISRRVEGLVVTLGSEGCEVWVDGVKTLVPAQKATEVVDPTGCGDAFRGRAVVRPGARAGRSCAARRAGQPLGATEDRAARAAELQRGARRPRRSERNRWRRP
jgi:sugar/nucleoside kinase (ribokinase family)